MHYLTNETLLWSVNEKSSKLVLNSERKLCSFCLFSGGWLAHAKGYPAKELSFKITIAHSKNETLKNVK